MIIYPYRQTPNTSYPGISLRILTLVNTCIIHFEVLVSTTASFPQFKTIVCQLACPLLLTKPFGSLSNNCIRRTICAACPCFVGTHFWVVLRATVVNVNQVNQTSDRAIEYRSFFQKSEFVVANDYFAKGGDMPSAFTCKIQWWINVFFHHNRDVITSLTVSQITGVSIVCWTFGSGANKKPSTPCVTGLCVGESIPHIKGQ